MEINVDNARFDFGKWPRIVITGKKVSKTLAKEFIERTDKFWFSPLYAGNDHKNIARYMENAGFTILENTIKERFPNLSSGQISVLHYNVIEKIKEELNHIDLTYLDSNLACSCYIGGPHGMISPDGEIYYNMNIGKWPEIDEIKNDLVAIATNFPTLDFKGSLYRVDFNDGEEDFYYTGCSFKVKNGKVTFFSEQLVDVDATFHTNDFVKHMEMLSYGLYSREWGLPETFYNDMGARIKHYIENMNIDDFCSRFQ